MPNLAALLIALAVVGEADWSLDATPLDRSADRLAADTDAHLQAARDLLAGILAADGPRTVENTLVPYNALAMHLDAASSECGLMEEVHPDAAVREVAKEGTRKVSRLATELGLSPELFAAFEALEPEGLDPETRFSIEKILLDFRRSGVDRRPLERGLIADLRDELTAIGQSFDRNIAEGVRKVRFPASVLEGMPADWVAKHPADAAGTVTVTTQYPDYIPFMTYCRDAAARKRMYEAYQSRAFPDNLGVLEELVRKRYRYARLLGYEDYADYVTADKMIGSAAAAQEFIDRVREVCDDAVARDYGMLLERKRRDVPGATTVADWEKAYYGELVRSERFRVDSQVVRRYFDFPLVQQGLFDVTARLFGVRYEPVEGLDLWHEDVTAWDLFEGDRRLGRFYLDLHPREDKYGHAACFGYRDGIAGQRLPQAVLVCNFPNPRDSEDGGALMEFGQVRTFFHEFGHLLHVLFGGHRRWMNNTGIATEWDFVEAPSQMLEEWVYDAETLRLFARHHETGEPIPHDLVERLRAARDFGKGSGTAHQMFYAALSLGLYDRPPAALDTTAMVRELQERYSPYDYVGGTHMQCSFGHLNGYSAIYYTYMWSKVIAKDLFSRFAEAGLLDRETALDYRRAVLEPGGSRPAAELVAEFLGRPYSFEAFEAWLNEPPEADA